MNTRVREGLGGRRKREREEKDVRCVATMIARRREGLRGQIHREEREVREEREGEERLQGREVMFNLTPKQHCFDNEIYIH